MVLQIFTVFDSKAEAFMTPFFMTSKGQAIRAFADIVNDRESQMHKHPGDYSLFHLGSFDDSNGAFKTVIPPVSLGLALEFLSYAAPADLTPTPLDKLIEKANTE